MGLTSRKSLTVGPPPLTDDLVRHFVRGYFDGNGTVGAYRNPSVRFGPPRLVSGFDGSRPMVNAVQQWLIGFGGLTRKKLLPNKTIWRVRYNHRESLLLAKWMYDGASVWLARKRQKFIDYDL
jgi:hypothetical protein